MKTNTVSKMGKIEISKKRKKKKDWYDSRIIKRRNMKEERNGV